MGSNPPAVIALLADDVLGEGRDLAVVDDVYEWVFADITADPRDRLGFVASHEGMKISLR